MDDKLPNLLKPQMKRAAIWGRSTIKPPTCLERVQYFQDICELNAIDGSLLEVNRSLDFLRDYRSMTRQLRWYLTLSFLSTVIFPAMLLNKHPKYKLMIPAFLVSNLACSGGIFIYLFSSLEDKYSIPDFINDPTFKSKFTAQLEWMEAKIGKNN